MSPSLHVLGSAALLDAGRPVDGAPTQRHRLALLAVLATAHPRPVTRDRLLALLWPERDAARGRALLSLAVHVLRRALGHDALRGVGDALALDSDRVEADVIGMMRAWNDGDAEGAVARWGGHFLEGFHLPASPEFERWVDAERQRFGGLHTRALARVAEERRARGDRAGAVEAWCRLGAFDTVGGATALRVVKGLAALGARSEALEHARRHGDALRAEFDAEPDHEVRVLAERLREPARVSRGVARTVGDVEQADELCARGRRLWAQRTPEQLRRAIGYFERAMLVAPDHPPALAGLADAWSVLGFYSHLPPTASFARAHRAARRALELQPRSSDSAASLAYVRLYHGWRGPLAERGFRRAIRLDPANVKAHQWLGNLLVTLARTDEAVETLRRVRKLAPALPISNAVPGWACMYAGRLDEAVDYLDEALELDPRFAIGWLWRGQTALLRGEWDGAVRCFEEVARLEPGSTGAIALAFARARAGDRDGAERCLAALRARDDYVPAYGLAKVELALGRRVSAVAELRRAYAERSHELTFLLVDPELAPLRDHGAVRDLAQRIGLAT